MGVAIQDANGRFIAARAVQFANFIEPFIAEALAARAGLVFAKELQLELHHVGR